MSLHEQQWDQVGWSKKKEEKKQPQVQKTVEYSDETGAPKKLGIVAGKQIQQARAKNRWSQYDLATRLGVKENVVKDYETGNVVPNRNVLNKLNRILEIRIVY